MHYSDPEVQAITAWLNKELEERGPVTPPNTETTAQAIKRVMNNFSGCMKLLDFQNANMRGDLGNMRSDQPNDACNSCHGAGEYGNMVSNIENQFYTTLSTHSRYMLQYFYVDTSMGAAQATMVINTHSFEMVSGGLPPHQQHPLFDPTAITQNASLVQFYNATMMNMMMAGPAGCGMTQLVD
jgi:hypothetical protein